MLALPDDDALLKNVLGSDDDEDGELDELLDELDEDELVELGGGVVKLNDGSALTDADDGSSDGDADACAAPARFLALALAFAFFRTADFEDELELLGDDSGSSGSDDGNGDDENEPLEDVLDGDEDSVSLLDELDELDEDELVELGGGVVKLNDGSASIDADDGSSDGDADACACRETPLLP
ncbi:hypothetical protein AGMMS49990_10040 [Endomicrobiia bacterium]|nr:hypothetical protein AGMMS49990_10040 [Endomicrobiia bacterium]